MKMIKLLQVIFMGAGLAVMANTNAAEVSCGNATLGVRLAVVDPGLLGGYCYAQLGNLQNTDIAALGLFQIEKDNDAASFSSGLLTATGAVGGPANGATSGTWTFDSNQWNLWDRIYLGFHFGGAGNEVLTNPDSFIVELSRPDFAGTWELAGIDAKLTGLSNMYLLRGAAACQTNCGGVVPEPSSVALLGLGLMGLLMVRRARSV